MDFRALQQRYEEEFNPKEYIPRIAKRQCIFHAFIEDKLHDIIDAMEVTPGMKLVDIGCGPTFCNVLAASRKFDDIVLSDLTEKNRCEAEKMARGSPDAGDMTRNAQLQALREVHSRDGLKNSEDILRRTRAAIRKVVPCNVLDSRVLPDEHWETFDVVLSSLCLEAAASDAATYKRALANVGNLVKPGGHLVLCGVTGCSKYTCGDMYFPSTVLSADLIKDALGEAGFRLTRWIEDKLSGSNAFDTYFDSCYVVMATRC